mgnify:CR=1 FL=1
MFSYELLLQVGGVTAVRSVIVICELIYELSLIALIHVPNVDLEVDTLKADINIRSHDIQATIRIKMADLVMVRPQTFQV